MEQKGGKVRGKVLFNKGLCTSAAREDSGVERQRGAAARKGLGGKYHARTMKQKWKSRVTA